MPTHCTLAALMLSVGSLSAAPPPRPSDYGSIDAHALAAPASAAQSFKSLASWLVAPCRTDEEKTRAIFRWITQNISYDVDAFFSGRQVTGSSGDALRSRRGVCEGYAGLFMELAKEAGLNAANISGTAKGFGYSAGESPGPASNHAWNAVSIAGEWKLLDCTWGAGYIGDDRRFHRDFNSHYFFTPPGEFVFDHLPEKPEWQLLGRPMTQSEFDNCVYLKPQFFSLGFRIPENRESTIRGAGEFQVRLAVMRPVAGAAAILTRGKTLDERYTFVQREGDALVIRATPPGPGEHVLRLFAKPSGDRGEYVWILDYRLQSSGPLASLPTYPRKFGAFDDGNVLLLEPTNGTLAGGSSYHFHLKAPGAEQTAVVVNSEWTILGGRGGEFEGDADIRSGVVTVYAKYPGNDRWDSLLEYRGK